MEEQTERWKDRRTNRCYFIEPFQLLLEVQNMLRSFDSCQYVGKNKISNNVPQKTKI